MAATETIQVPGNIEGVKPLSARLIHVTGKYAEIGVTNNLRTPIILNKVFYISTAAGSTVEGVKEKPGIVKQIKFTVSVPSTLESNSLSIHLTFYAETHGVYFTKEITVSNDLKPLSVRIIQVIAQDAEIGVTNNRQTPVILNKVFYISTVAGSTVKGVKEKPVIVKPHEEIRFTVSVPSTLVWNSLSIHFTFNAETLGVYFTEEITVSDDLNPVSVRIIQVIMGDTKIGVRNNLQTPVTINKVFYVSKVGGSIDEGSKDNIGTVRPNEEIRFAMYIPSMVEPYETYPFSLDLNFYAETDGVHFTEKIAFERN